MALYWILKLLIVIDNHLLYEYYLKKKAKKGHTDEAVRTAING